MILGNSFGKNKGKKYFIRRKHNHNPDILHAEEAERFNEWFGRNYLALMQDLKSKYAYGEDAMNDTYIRMYESILYSGLEINDYKSYFFRSYYTNYVNDSMRNNRYTPLLPNFDKSDTDSEYFAEIEAKQQKLENDIFNYIYSNYDIRDFELFKMYITLKPAVNYISLADITGVKLHNVQRIIAKIKKDIRRNHDFSRRWRDVG